MTRLRRRERERGLEDERFAKLIAAGALTGQGAMDEGEMLVGVGALPGRQPAVDRALQVLRRLDVITVIELVQADVQRRGLGLHGAKNRPPRRVTHLRRRELERGREGKRFAKLVTAGALAARGAMDEGEMLVGARALGVAEPLVACAL